MSSSDVVSDDGKRFTLGAVYPKKDGGIVLSGNDGRSVDVTDVFGAIREMTASQERVKKNPWDADAPKMMFRAHKTLMNVEKRMADIGQVADLGAVANIARGLVKSAKPLYQFAAEAHRLHAKASARLLMHPTQTIPLCFNAGAAANVASFTIQNPYIGSGGGVYNAAGIWAITGLESTNLTSCTNLRITSAVFAGHDYVSASLNGIQTSSGNVVAVKGWGWQIFASDKRERAHTVFSPWNLQGASGIVGSIMRETGTVTLAFVAGAIGGNPLVGDVVFHVHVKASLCGSPFSGEHLAKFFVPWQKQLKAARYMARHHGGVAARAMRSSRGSTIRGLDGDMDVDGALEDEMGFGDEG